MDPFSLPPISAVLDAGYTALMTLSHLLQPAAGTSAAAASVVLVTLVVRALLIPIGRVQAKAEQARSRLAPRLKELQRRYGDQPERLQRETMQLYRDAGTSPFAGCLPMLLQAPVVGVLYAIFLHPEIAGHANALLTELLLGVPLGTSLAGVITSGIVDPMPLLVCGAVVLLVAALGELTRRLLRLPQPGHDAGSSTPGIASGIVGALHFATAAVAVFVPLAAALYLVVTAGWTLVQRLILRRVYPLVADPDPRSASE